MTDVLVLPGQGVQRLGMGADLFDRYPRMVRQADEVLGHSVRRLCSGDTERPLHRTLHTQPAVFVVNALACRRWEEDHGRRPDLALGHSLGEYNALCVAGAFGFQEGLALVARRAALMDTVRGGGMSAVIGLTVDQVRARLTRPSLRRLDVAAVNTEEQVVLAGPHDALEAAVPALRAAGALRVVPLEVSAPFHSRYLSGAAKRYAEVLKSTDFAPPAFPVVANRTARPHRIGTVRDHLAEHLTHTVQWAASLRHVMTRYPDAEFHEIGGAGPLTAMVRHTRRGLSSSPPTDAILRSE
ncbi:ACP S-malonyltransferase [Streptomyces sp. NPDC002640]